MPKKALTTNNRVKNILLLTTSSVCLIGTLVTVWVFLRPTAPRAVTTDGAINGLTPEIMHTIAALPANKTQALMNSFAQGTPIKDIIAQVQGLSDTTNLSHTDFMILSDPTYQHLRIEPMRDYTTQNVAQSRAAGTQEPPHNVEVIDEQINGAVGIFWQEPSYTRGVHINIYESQVSGTGGKRVATVPMGTYFYERQGLTNGSWYYYTLKSVADDGTESAPSLEVSVRPSDNLAPPQPRHIQSTPQKDGTIQLRWDEVDAPDLAYYEVYRSAQKGILGSRMTQVDPAKTSWHDVQTQSGTTYYYTVVAVDATGNASPHELVHPGNPNPFKVTTSKSTL